MTGSQLEIDFFPADPADCLGGVPSAGFATVTVDLATHQVTASIACAENAPGPCIGVPSDRYDIQAAGTYRCAPGAASCVRGDIVTCDAAGTVTSSISCQAPCAP